jgi:predicted TIM-barrel fold metal-dependent hydrolase
MFAGKKVIDCHGHMSTPPHFRAFAYNLIALRTPGDELVLTEAQLKAPIERHLRMLDSHNIDVQMISPRPVAMMQWESPYLVGPWTEVTNNVIAQQCDLWSDRFVGIAQLPQSRDLDSDNCVPELERAHGLGFVGATVNPDPGGDGLTPGMNDEYWYALYESAEALEMTLVVHPSISRDPRIEILSHSYQFNNVKEEWLATLLLEQSDVFERFPKLRIVICHCGGALDRFLKKGRPVDAVKQAHGEDTIARDSGERTGGSIEIAAVPKKAKKRVDVSNNLFFDTCCYDPHFLGAAIKQRGVNRMVFGTEVPGSGSDILNPETGAAADDVLALIDSFDFLTEADKLAIVHDNPLRMFPRLTKTRALAGAGVMVS